jgi:hypothetical protein
MEECAVAIYASPKRVRQLRRSDENPFGNVYGPSETVPVSGIYACTGCWYEDVCIEGTDFPPENYEHQHASGEYRLPVRWRLVVMPSHERSLDRYYY